MKLLYRYFTTHCHINNMKILRFIKAKSNLPEEVAKKRSRRAVKFQRAITGASLAEILAKRNQKPEVRKAQREQSVTSASKQKIAKPMKVSAPRVGGKR
uniref:60S ribosomal protein L24 n=1 Tax=Cyprinus carpio TaxID=7962 RepID=A0A8C2H6F2_CYPCA